MAAFAGSENWNKVSKGVLSGKGRMHLSKKEFIVGENDAIIIPHGIEHYIENIGDNELVFLCCSTPPYTNEDTEIL